MIIAYLLSVINNMNIEEVIINKENMYKSVIKVYGSLQLFVAKMLMQ